MSRIAPPGMARDTWSALHAEARARAEGREPAHDFFHVERVVANACTIGASEGADIAIVATAALLHELFSYPKGHPDSSKSGDVCATHARTLLESHRLEAPFVDAVTSAIADHAFSKGAVPDALTAQILQDADRLDAIGAIGLARMWATCADMKRPFYDPGDPFCDHRAPDDKVWGLDHVYKKLLRIPERLHTDAARRMAEARVVRMKTYLEGLRDEIQPGSP